MSSATFVVSNWKEFEKGALRGFLDIELPSGMILRGCSLVQKDGRRWIGTPSKPVGEGKYQQVVEFVSKEVRDKFSAAALESLDNYLAVGR